MDEHVAMTGDEGERLATISKPETSTVEGKVPPAWARVALDILERVFVVLMFGLLAWSVIASVKQGATWVNPLLLATEGLNVVFILVRRRAANVSYRPADWVVAFGAVSFSLAVRPGHAPPLTSPLIAAALVLTGLGLQIWSKLTLRRSFGITPANRGVTVRGPYAIIRHPMYLGYLLAWIGFYLVNPTIWNTNIYAMCVLLQWLRIESEERVLSKDPAYAAYKTQVRYRVIPGVY